MTQYKVICLFVAIAGGLCLATAQSSQVGSSSAKRGADPLQTATKPLTPKSAMPPQRKSPVVAPKASAGTAKTDLELTHLERQNIKAPSAKTSSAAKGVSVPKSASPSAGSSGIDFKYQKPAGGKQAATPEAHSANSATPRVKKN
jgi:hypothetical protein